MFIIKLVLKIVFSPVYVPYVIIKWLGSGNSSSARGTSGTSPTPQMPGKVGIPLVTINKAEAGRYEIVGVKPIGGRQIQVAYKEKGATGPTRILIDRPSKQRGPVRVDWSKTIS